MVVDAILRAMAFAVLAAALALGGGFSVAWALDHAKPAAAEKAGPAAGKKAKSGRHRATKVYLAFPIMNAENGMRLFASKGCVAWAGTMPPRSMPIPWTMSCTRSNSSPRCGPWRRP